MSKKLTKFFKNIILYLESNLNLGYKILCLKRPEYDWWKKRATAGECLGKSADHLGSLILNSPGFLFFSGDRRL